MKNILQNELPGSDARDCDTPYIQPGNVLMDIVYMVLHEVTSLRALGHATNHGCYFTPRANASDTTCRNALAGPVDLDRTIQAITDWLNGQGLLESTTRDGTDVTFACVDGTCMGNHYFAAASLHGQVDVLCDLNEYNFGSEREAADDVIKRLPESTTHLGLDGLYASRVLEYHQDHDLHPVIKLGSQQCADNNRLIDKASFDRTDEVRDTDRDGNTVKHVLYADTVAMTDRDGRTGDVKVVEDTVCKKGPNGTWQPVRTRYYITTDTDLSAACVWELTVKRWAIESLFKRLNKLFGTKSSYVHESNVKRNLVLLQALGLTLIQYEKAQMGRELMREAGVFDPRECTFETVIALCRNRLRGPP